jgi:predicted aspartyl protease
MGKALVTDLSWKIVQGFTVIGPTLGLLYCASLMGADLAQLRQLEEARRIFDLRTALESGGSDGETLFYRALVAARFGEDAIAVEQLRRFLDTRPDREMQRKAHEELASVHVRASRFGDAASEYAAALQLMPTGDGRRLDLEEDRVICELLRDTPSQTIEFEKDVPVNARLLDAWIVPVNVNGKTAEWIFDTGANFSVVTESEAARIGLSVHESSGTATGSTGKRNSVRIAVAQDMHFGAAHLRNVAFAVIADNTLPRQAPRGILGFPVIRALGHVSISSKGVVRIDPGSTIASGDPNLFLEGLTPIVQVHHGGHALQMVLDTGAGISALYPAFRTALSPEENAQLRKKDIRSTGIGETVVGALDVAPKLHLELPGKAVDLVNISLQSRQPDEFRFEDGRIGMDALAGGFTLDFRAMQLRLN